MAGTVKAVAIIIGDANVRGSIQFVQTPYGPTHVTGRITGLSPGLHGFHIHALGDTTNGCNSTGPHFNPLKKDHGAPTAEERHAGDLGNIFAGSDGIAEISIRDMQIPLIGQHSILGRAVVVHADCDDLGIGGHELSKTTGNAGARVGCGNNSILRLGATNFKTVMKLYSTYPRHAAEVAAINNVSMLSEYLDKLNRVMPNVNV